MEWVRFNKTGFPPTPLWDQLLARELYGRNAKKREKKEEENGEGRERGAEGLRTSFFNAIPVVEHSPQIPSFCFVFLSFFFQS
jgi:hypothetical protein